MFKTEQALLKIAFLHIQLFLMEVAKTWKKSFSSHRLAAYSFSSRLGS